MAFQPKDSSQDGHGKDNQSINRQQHGLQPRQMGRSMGRSMGRNMNRFEQPQQSSSTKGGLDKAVQAKMEKAFQSDFSDVNITQNSSEATNMGALAFTQGNDVHFAPGQYNPGTSEGQELIGHELTHVIQQKQGRVKATTQAKGVVVNDDPALENEADVMGKKAASGEHVIVQKKSKSEVVQKASIPSIFPNEEVKKRYLDNTRERILQAYTNFSSAITECKAEIKDAAEKVPSVAGLLIEVSMGFLIPGAGKLLSRMVNNIPNRAPDIAYNLALAVQNEKITGPILGVIGGEAKKGLQDLLISEARKDAVSQNTYADIFRTQQGIAFQTLRESMTLDTPDITIFTNFHAYDAAIATVPAYKASITALLNRFKNQVLALDDQFATGTMGSSTTIRNKLARVPYGGKSKLALVRETNSYNLYTTFFGEPTSYFFDQWISNDMQELAINKAGGENKILNLERDEVENLP
ncbi:hypothetical protein GCM10011506_25410 [Marivirga lumbricoides]|uniref:eCIS core domain-containing protein n=1 Tax=Marivirga lumbricoides TaxID=1046115 RepID=A0ABQ1MH13_9BACT|nr:hypothetical protein GCM10011506_25410 [Marivirga lumbricoides]